mgnify:CR=1 FL=1
MNHYETVLIVTPGLAEGEAAKMVTEYVEYLKSNDAEIVHREDWGLKQLAYPIQKKTTGLYFLVEYKVDPSVIQKFEIGLQRDESVMRFLTVKLEKYGIEWAEERRNRLSGKSSAPARTEKAEA